MNPIGLLVFHIILTIVITTTSAQLRHGVSSDVHRSPFHPPDEHGNTLINYEEKHLQPPIRLTGPQKSPFSPPGPNVEHKNLIPAPSRPRVKSIPNLPKSQTVKTSLHRNVQTGADNKVSPFQPPSGIDQARKTSAVPEVKPKPRQVNVVKSRVKGAKRQPPPPSTRLDNIIARNQDNSREIPSISDIRLRARTISEPAPRPVISRRRERVRPRHTSFQNSRRPKQSPPKRDMHEVGPGVTPWTRYTARPRNAPRRPDSKSSSFKGRCGKVSYSPREQICCQGSVSRRQGTQPSCCGRRAYDSVYKKCCGGKVHMLSAQVAGC